MGPSAGFREGLSSKARYYATPPRGSRPGPVPDTAPGPVEGVRPSYSRPSLSVKGTGGQSEAWHYVSVGSLNVRAAPVQGAQIVGVLYRNQRVLVGETEKGWARIIKPERGFVAAQFLVTHPVQ